MKNIKIRRFGMAILLLFILAGCKKESQNIFNMFDVQVELHTKHPFSVGEYKEVNDGDSIYIDFTVTSPTKDLYQVGIFKVGNTAPFLRFPVPEGQRRSYSGVAKLKANENVGLTTYRIWALDKDGVYIGDGYKKITINVKSNFTLLPNRNIYLPDSVNKSTNNYFSLMKGTNYNYASGQANAADIDLGIYRKLTTSTTNPWTYHIYSLSSSPLPYIVDDISAWTKRATLFSAPITNRNNVNAVNIFNTILTTGTKIETEAKKETITSKSITANVPVGSIVYFLTPEGKYGVMLVNAITSNYSGAPFMNVSVKYKN